MRMRLGQWDSFNKRYEVANLLGGMNGSEPTKWNDNETFGGVKVEQQRPVNLSAGYFNRPQFFRPGIHVTPFSCNSQKIVRVRWGSTR